MNTILTVLFWLVIIYWIPCLFKPSRVPGALVFSAVYLLVGCSYDLQYEHSLTSIAICALGLISSVVYFHIGVYLLGIRGKNDNQSLRYVTYDQWLVLCSPGHRAASIPYRMRSSCSGVVHSSIIRRR